MVNQSSLVPFGTDATILAGFAYRVNDRIGNIDFIFENVGPNTLYVKLMEQTNASGAFIQVGPSITLVPKGAKTVSYNIAAQKVGFFGSGSTTCNISSVLRNPGNLRGANVDIVLRGRQGWTYDPAFDQNAFLSPGWGNPDSLV